MERKPIVYCTRCLYPSSKPDLLFEDGVCGACLNFKTRDSIDWNAREKEFLNIVDRYRSKNDYNYDCIVGVSGGKDSTYQVIKMKEYGLNPLCVVATTCFLSEIGKRNIENLKNLGVDCVEVTSNPNVTKKMNRLALELIGDISWPEHIRIFTTPPRVAVQTNVPLIVWGECGQNEYGGPAASAKNNVLNRRWLEEFGTRGLRITDIVGQIDITQRDLIPFQYPSDEDIERVGVTGVFLGYYIPWDGHKNTLIAQSYGFETYPTVIETTMANYENLDSLHHGIHDYFKYLKYGFSRASDIACNHIRRGRLTRAEGLEIVKMHDGKFPWTYLGVPIEKVLERIDMTIEEFIQICDDFTNKKIFICDKRGNLVKDSKGNLTKINDDNA